jgi:hypothetical protein
MESDTFVTNRDDSDVPEIIQRAVLSAFACYCSTDSLAVVLGTVATLPERDRMDEDIQLLLWEDGKYR